MKVKDAKKDHIMTHTFYLAYTTVKDSYKIVVDVSGTSALTLVVVCGDGTTDVTGGATWTTSGLSSV